MTRYLEREDADEIKHALYDFLMATCGFIAHFGLVPPDGGFRIAYREPADLIDELLAHHHQYGEGWSERGEPHAVMADGMTDLDVYREIAALAVRGLQRARAGADQRQAERELHALKALAKRHGLLLIPNGSPTTDSPQGQLFAA